MQIDWKDAKTIEPDDKEILFLYREEDSTTLNITMGNKVGDIYICLNGATIPNDQVEAWVYSDDLIPVIKREVNYYYPVCNDLEKKSVAEWLSRCKNYNPALNVFNTKMN